MERGRAGPLRSSLFLTLSLDLALTPLQRLCLFPETAMLLQFGFRRTHSLETRNQTFLVTSLAVFVPYALNRLRRLWRRRSVYTGARGWTNDVAVARLSSIDGAGRIYQNRRKGSKERCQQQL